MDTEIENCEYDKSTQPWIKRRNRKIRNFTRITVVKLRIKLVVPGSENFIYGGR